MDDNVNARSDDLPPLQVMSGLNSNPEILVSKSKTFKNCLLVRAETPTSRFQERRREMAEIEPFLKQDWRFRGFVEGLDRVNPGKEREDWLLHFFRGVQQQNRHKGDDVLFKERYRQACVYVTLYDEDRADESGLAKEREPLQNEWSSSHFDRSRGKWVHSSLVQYSLGQCRRASRSSHVEDGGGVALEPDTLKRERTSGPSDVEDGGGDALQRISQEKDRSSPLQSLRFRAGSDRHNVGIGREDSS
jgi:hypothetical protein